MEIDKKQVIYSFAGIFLFLILMTIYVKEFFWLQNTFETRTLLILCVLFGITVGFFLGKKLTQNERDFIDKLRIYLLMMVTLGIFSPLFGSLTNRLLTFCPVVEREFLFLEQKPYASERFGLIKGQEIEPEGFYTFILVKDKPFRIKSKQALFVNKNKGDRVRLPVQRGLLGFEVILVE